LTAARLDSWLRSVYSDLATFEALENGNLSQASCGRMAPYFPHVAISVLVGDRVLCKVAAPSSTSLSDAVFPVNLGDASAPLWRDGMVIALGEPRAIVVLKWPQGILDAIVGTPNPDFESATVTDAKGRTVFESRPSSFTGHSSAASRDDAADSLSITRPIGQTNLFVTVAYPRSSFTPPPDIGFWAVASAIFAITAAIGLASAWTIDRTVGSWIGYLRRVAILHSKGRVSVRARRLTEAMP
jgi:hypothetical protein